MAVHGFSGNLPFRDQNFSVRGGIADGAEEVLGDHQTV